MSTARDSSSPTGCSPDPYEDGVYPTMSRLTKESLGSDLHYDRHVCRVSLIVYSIEPRDAIGGLGSSLAIDGKQIRSLSQTGNVRHNCANRIDQYYFRILLPSHTTVAGLG